MLVAGVNDSAGAVDAVAAVVAGLGASISYLAVPTRPPAFPGVRPPGEAVLNRAYQRMARRLPRVELLVGYEGDAFASTGDVAADVLAITAVHPLRGSAVAAMLVAGRSDWAAIDALVESGELRRVRYRGDAFYVRRYGG
jgi:wyosine [tRNA(Phe)-imidazoG37] synthetase (radical SAM superfamily)